MGGGTHARAGRIAGRRNSAPADPGKATRLTTSPEAVTLTTDVLVIGGGPAGTWAAIKAAEAGMDVVLADKGYTGASGATASAGTGVWYANRSAAG